MAFRKSDAHKSVILFMLALSTPLIFATTIQYDFVNDQAAEATIVKPSFKSLFARVEESDQNTEAGIVGHCPSCRLNQNILDLQAVVLGELKVGDLTTWKRKGALVQVPVEGAKGPCGSEYLGKEPPWLSPSAACVLLASLQEWKKRCAKEKDCRIAFGATNDNRDGHCVDVQVMKDRTATLELLTNLYAKGAAKVDFKEDAKSLRTCFKPSKTTDEACRAFKFDAALCGTE